MGLFKKKADPISDRARALSEEIAALEVQIKQLDTTLAATPPPPRLRSTAMPHGASTINHTTAPPPASAEPVFEEVDQDRLKEKPEPDNAPDLYNELGVRKYDLASFFQRLKNHFRGPSTANPKLVSYLAAGSIQGLRPMRYEKRVARNRFLFVAGIILLVLIGLFFAFSRRH